MDLPPELLSTIISHLKVDSKSFRDMRAAFTCKALYQELGPLIAEEQCTVLENAANREAFSFTHHSLDDRAFIRFLEGVILRGELPSDRRSPPSKLQNLYLNLTVKSRHDIDLVWSVQRLLIQAQKLHPRVISSLYLCLQPSRLLVLSELGLNEPGLTVSQKRARVRDAAKATLIPWGDLEDQQALSRALLSLCHTAIELEGLQLDIRSDLSTVTRLDEPPFTEDQLLPLESTMPSEKARISTLILYSLPAPRLFPFPHLDALVCGSSSSLIELDIGSCFRSIPSHTAWSLILDRWSFPQLVKLSIRHMGAPLLSLVSFLMRNPSITTSNFVLWVSPSECALGETMLCPTLQHLSANPELLLPLLQSASAVFPNLDALEIIQGWVSETTQKNSSFKYCTMDDVTTILSCIPTAAPALRALTLYLAHPGELEKWLASASSQPEGAEPPPCADEISSSEGGRLSSLRTVLGRLQNVEELHFRPIPDRRSKHAHQEDDPRIFIQPQLVVNFIAAFPALKHVYLCNAFQGPVFRRDWETEYPSFWQQVATVWEKTTILEKVELSDVGIDEHCSTTAVLVREPGTRGGSESASEPHVLPAEPQHQVGDNEVVAPTPKPQNRFTWWKDWWRKWGD